MSDTYDVGAWEFVTRKLAERCEIKVPDASLAKFNSNYHTYCSKRFDRFKGLSSCEIERMTAVIPA